MPPAGPRPYPFQHCIRFLPSLLGLVAAVVGGEGVDECLLRDLDPTHSSTASASCRHFLALSPPSSVERASMNASCGPSTLPIPALHPLLAVTSWPCRRRRRWRERR